MIKCYTPAVITNNSPSGCTDINTYLPDPQKQAAAPFLYNGGLTPTLNTAAGATALTVTAAQPGFKMLFFPQIWGAAMNAPSASTSVPF
jgi:hypothetical protein